MRCWSRSLSKKSVKKRGRYFVPSKSASAERSTLVRSDQKTKAKNVSLYNNRSNFRKADKLRFYLMLKNVFYGYREDPINTISKDKGKPKDSAPFTVDS